MDLELTEQKLMKEKLSQEFEGQKKTCSISALIQNIENSINHFKTENKLSPEGDNQLYAIENELLTNLKEFKIIKSHLKLLLEMSTDARDKVHLPLPEHPISAYSIEAEDVPRVIVCGVTKQNVPRVVVCDENYEVLKYSDSMSCDGSDIFANSLSCSNCTDDIDHVEFVEHIPQNICCNSNHVTCEQILKDEPLEIEDSDCSLQHNMSCNSPMVVPAKVMEETNCLNCNAIIPQFTPSTLSCCSDDTKEEIVHCIEEAPDSHFNSYKFANTLSSKMTGSLVLPQSTLSTPSKSPDGPKNSGKTTSGSFTVTCQHIKSGESMSPSAMPCKVVASCNQNSQIKNVCTDVKKSSPSMFCKREESKTILNSLSKDFKNAQNNAKLKDLEEENQKLLKDLKNKEARIMRLEKEMQCLHVELGMKENEDKFLKHTQNTKQSQENFEPNDMGCSSDNTRIVDGHCPCTYGNQCVLEKQISDMDNDLMNLKKELEVIQNGRCKSLELAQQIIDDWNECTKNESSERNPSSHPENFHPVSISSNDEFQCLESSRENSSILDFSPFCDKVVPKEEHNLDLQTNFCELTDQNRWLLESAKQNLSNEDDLQSEICRLQNEASILQSHLQCFELKSENLCECDCSYASEKRDLSPFDSENCGNCSNLVEQLKRSEVNVSNLEKQLDLCNSEACRISNKLKSTKDLGEHLESELECCKGKVKETELKLESSIEKVANLEDFLERKEEEIESLKNLCDVREGKIAELEKKRGLQDLELQTFKNRFCEIEKQLRAKENEIVEKEATICSLKEQLDCCQNENQLKLKLAENTVSELQQELKCHVSKIADFEKEKECKDRKISELEKQAASSNVLILTLENELKCSDGRVIELESLLKSSKETITSLKNQVKCSDQKIKDLEAMVECEKNKVTSFENQLQCSGEKIKELEELLECRKERLCCLENQVKISDGKIKELEEFMEHGGKKNASRQEESGLTSCKMKNFQDKLNRFLNNSSQLNDLKEEFENRIDCLQKENMEAQAIIEQQKCDIKRLEETGASLRCEMAGEIEHIKHEFMDKLGDLNPFIALLEKAQSKLDDALVMFETSEKKCAFLSKKLEKASEELEYLKNRNREKIFQTSSTSMKVSKNSSSRGSGHSNDMKFITEAYCNLRDLMNERKELKSAMELLMHENKEKDCQLEKTIENLESLKRDIELLRHISDPENEQNED